MTQRTAAAADSKRRPMNLHAANGGRPQLLLAEDSDPVRIVTAAMLKGMGCDVEAVIHGEQAVKCASEHRFDVIVLDIEMPIMDGITAARSIRRMGGLAAGTPLMALSAFLADSVRTGHWRDTFDIALPKPANKNELHDAVKTALHWQRPVPSLAWQSSPSACPTAATSTTCTRLPASRRCRRSCRPRSMPTGRARRPHRARKRAGGHQSAGTSTAPPPSLHSTGFTSTTKRCGTHHTATTMARLASCAARCE